MGFALKSSFAFLIIKSHFSQNLYFLRSEFSHMSRNTMGSDDAFFQPDWAGACWGRWAGTWAAAGLVCRLWMWHR